MITQPISANQVVDVPIDLKCLTVSCKDLPRVLQALVDKVCEAGPSYDTLDFGSCVEPAEDLLGTLQSIIDAIDCNRNAAITTANNLDLTGLTTCSTDGWNCASADACLTFTNTCSPGDITVEVVTQALIDRIVAQGNTIKSLCARITTLEGQMATANAQISSIQSTCCP